MGHIWKSIVAEPKKTVDEYFDSIVDDLLAQSGSRLWRSREASCLALADIIQGRKFSQVDHCLKSEVRKSYLSNSFYLSTPTKFNFHLTLVDGPIRLVLIV